MTRRFAFTSTSEPAGSVPEAKAANLSAEQHCDIAPHPTRQPAHGAAWSRASKSDWDACCPEAGELFAARLLERRLSQRVDEGDAFIGGHDCFELQEELTLTPTQERQSDLVGEDAGFGTARTMIASNSASLSPTLVIGSAETDPCRRTRAPRREAIPTVESLEVALAWDAHCIVRTQLTRGDSGDALTRCCMGHFRG